MPTVLGDIYFLYKHCIIIEFRIDIGGTVARPNAADAAFKIHRTPEGWSGWVSLDLPHEPPTGFIEWCTAHAIVKTVEGPRTSMAPHHYSLQLLNARNSDPRALQLLIALFLEEVRHQLGGELTIDDQGIHTPIQDLGMPGVGWVDSAARTPPLGPPLGGTSHPRKLIPVTRKSYGLPRWRHHTFTEWVRQAMSRLLNVSRRRPRR